MRQHTARSSRSFNPQSIRRGRAMWGELLESRHVLSSFSVVNVLDSGSGSLRQAILNANANPGADTIGFAIPGAGLHAIMPTTPLPALTGPTVVDGYTQSGSAKSTSGPGATPNFVINVQLNGSQLTGYDRSAGLEIAGGSSIVRGLNITSFRGTAMRLSTTGGDVVEGNSIAGNIVVQPGPNNNTIGGLTPEARNVVSIIGINSDGNTVVGNITNGMGVSGSGNTIGGTTPAARNIASGNSKYGIQVSGSNNIVLGNFIGTDITGTQAVKNRTAGVFLTGANNIIGGTAAGAANIISGNSRGVYIYGGSNNTVQGNLIGVDVNGHVLGNSLEGVQITANGANNLIGGTTPAARNFISGNRTGVTLFLGATANLIQGNSIGVLPDGTAAGNSFAGVYISSTATNNAIGGTAGGAGNIIAFSTGISGTAGDGVFVESLDGAPAPVGNAILGNSIFSNAGLGIDLTPDGVNANDAGDGDSGSNNRQNYPVLASATSSASGVTVQGSLSSTPNRSFRVEIFASPAADPSGFGEGKTFLGALTVSTGASGTVSFSFHTSTASTGSQVVSATATDSANNTSEFSRAITLVTTAQPTGFTAARSLGDSSSATPTSLPQSAPQDSNGQQRSSSAASSAELLMSSVSTTSTASRTAKARLKTSAAITDAVFDSASW